MPGDDFFRTRMGQRFYEATMPKIADQLERLNTNIEVLIAELQKLQAPGRNEEPAPVPAARPRMIRT
jgi:hypothetical protein